MAMETVHGKYCYFPTKSTPKSSHFLCHLQTHLQFWSCAKNSTNITSKNRLIYLEIYTPLFSPMDNEHSLKVDINWPPSYLVPSKVQIFISNIVLKFSVFQDYQSLHHNQLKISKNMLFSIIEY